MSAGEVKRNRGEAPPEEDTFWTRRKILHEEKENLSLSWCVEERVAGAAVAWLWSMGTPSPTAQEGQGGLAAVGVQVRDVLVECLGLGQLLDLGLSLVNQNSDVNFSNIHKFFIYHY